MRVALYCRVSTDEQKQGGTIESQIKELDVFAATRGDAVVEKYIDEGWSGSLLNRPALDALRDAAERKAFEAVLINDVDRLSRDIANLGVVKRDLERKGVALIFRKLPADKGPLSDFMVNILGSFAEFERAMITDRTRRGRRYKVQERQLIIGNKPPYGFNYVKKDRDQGVEGHYEINSEEARVVRMMFSWLAHDGISERAVTRKLNALGIPARHSRSWAWSSVHRILANETYAGITHYNKHKVEDAGGWAVRTGKFRATQKSCRLRPRTEWIAIPLPPHLHLVDRDTFDRAQAQLQRNRAFSLRNAKHFYLLREVRKVCGRCGAAYVGTPYHGKPFYRCSNRDNTRTLPDRPRCHAKIVSARKIESVVWQSVENAIQDPQLIAQHVNQLQQRYRAERATTQTEADAISRDLAALGQEEDRVLAAYRTGVTSLLQFEKEIAKVNERRAVLDVLLAKATRDVPPVVPEEEITRDLAQWSAAVRDRLPLLTGEERQQLLGALLSQIVIDSDVLRIRGEIPASGGSGIGVVPTASYRTGHNPPNIVPTSSGGRGHNVTYGFEVILSLTASRDIAVAGFSSSFSPSYAHDGVERETQARGAT